MIRKVTQIALFLTISITTIGCSNPTLTKGDMLTEKVPAALTALPEETVTHPTVSERKVTLMAVGDIMVHQEQLEAAWDGKKKTYDFAPFFSKVVPIFKQTDWVIGNLETTLSGSDARFTGYPQFNSPESLATTLKQVGFTAVTTANNHSLDRREAGVLKTVENLNKAGLLHTGTFRNPEERSEPLLLKKNGITMAVLAYTYGTNGIPIPKGKPYLVNLIDSKLIGEDIARARALGADVVSVALHFGAEYQRKPNDFQRQVVDQCLGYGADLILGAHPHVVQPYEWRTVTLANGEQHTGFVAYSLGNFISAQRYNYKDVGAILKLTLTKRGVGKTKLEQVELIPTYVYYYRKGAKRYYSVYPLPQTLQAAAQTPKNPLLTKELIGFLSKLNQEMSVHVRSLVSKKKTS